MHLKFFQELVDIKLAAHSELKCLGLLCFYPYFIHTCTHTQALTHTHLLFSSAFATVYKALLRHVGVMCKPD